MNSQFLRNAFLNVFSVLLGILSPLILIPVLTSSLGLDIYGKYMAILALVAMFAFIGDLGLDMYLSKEISIQRDNKQECSKLLFEFLIIKFVAVLLLTPVLIFLIVKTINIVDELLILNICLMVFISALRPVCILTGLEQYKQNAFFDLIGKIILISLVLTLDFAQNGLSKALFVQLLSLGITVLLSYYYLFNRVKLRGASFSLYSCKELVVKSFGFYTARLFVNIYSQASTYLVSLFLTGEMVGIYSIGIQLYKVGQAVIGAISKVLYTSTVKTRNFSLVKKATLIVLFLQIVFSPLIIFWGQDILSLALGINSEELLSIAKILYVSLLFTTVSSFWGYPVMVAINKEKLAHIGIFFGSLFYYISFFIFYVAENVNLYMAVMCILISDLSSMLIRIYFSKKELTKERRTCFG